MGGIEPPRRRRNARAAREDRIAEQAEERMRQSRRVLPNDVDAEAGVLGGIMIEHHRMVGDADAIKAFMARLDWLEADDFYDPRHRFVFTAIRELEAAGKPIDVVTIETGLAKMGKLDACGGVTFLGELALRCPTPDNTVVYAESVRDKRVLRSVMEAASEVVELGYSAPDITDGEMTSRLAEIIAYVNHRRPIARGRFLGEIVKEKAQGLRDIAEKRRKNPGKEIAVGVPTGLAKVDELLGGHPKGFPLGIVGRSAAGKTSLIQQVADHQAWWLHREGRKELCVVCSNEDAEDPFTFRAIAHFGAIDSAAVRRAQIEAPDAAAAFERGVEAASQSRIYFMPIHGKTGAEVAADLRRLHSQHGIAVVWVDYLQNMAWPEGVRDEQTAITKNTQALVALQGEIQCALGLGAQLNRDIDDRPWKEGGPVPRKKDIRGSGWLDIAIKVLIALYHPWPYSRQVSWSEEHRLDPRSMKGKEKYVTPDLLEGHLLKNSLGRDDEIFYWSFERKFARFETYQERPVQPPLPGHRGPAAGPAQSQHVGPGAHVPPPGHHPNAPGAE